MKIGKYIIEIVDKDAHNFNLLIPYKAQISYNTNKIITGESKRQSYRKSKKLFSEEYMERKGFFVDLKQVKFIECKYLELGTGTRYSILGKYWIFLVIKQIN